MNERTTPKNEKMEQLARNLWAAPHTYSKEAAECLRRLSDPVAVHMNMLVWNIAMPSVENIIHLYGAEVLRAALVMKETDWGPPVGKEAI